MNYLKKQSLVIPFALLLFWPGQNVCSAFGKKKESANAKTTEQESKDKSDIKSIKEIAKKCKKKEGLFTIYQDTTNGSCYLLIKKNQIDKEFIYFTHIVDGILAAGHFRGSYQGNEVFTIRKYFNKIEFVTENTSFYFDTSNALNRAASANISRAVMASLPIVAKDSSNSSWLIKADDIFLTETLHQVKPSASPNERPGGSFSLGSLSKEKTKYSYIKSYPLNTDIIVEYVYDNPAPTVGGGPGVTDSRYITIKLQHSFIAVPDNDYKPRYDDPRIGYFADQVNDMTSTSPTPYRDLIHRWNLQKKDKNAALSEPVEPIVWWIENTTPVEYRETIKEAALRWNEAFEAAGFRNAVEVKIQPDNADWDAGDIRYNVLRWTSSPQPPFGGYGPSFVNPKTGQILGADIMLEFVYLTNRIQFEKVFETGGLLTEPGTNDNDLHADGHYCNFSYYLQMSTLFGVQALNAAGATEEEKKELIKQSVYRLVLHEMGHTFGLNHNFKASQLHSPAELKNKELVDKTGLTNSVMEYPAINLALDKSKQTLFYDTKTGFYDKWAIEYGYSQASDNKSDEQQRLQKILSRSTEPELLFANDAEAISSPENGIDPRAMMFDLSNDVVTYSVERIVLTDTIAKKLKQKFSIPGHSYHELRNAYLIVTGEQASAINSISRYIGGVYVDRAFSGQKNAGKPYTPVSYAYQKKAMDALTKYAFSPKAFAMPSDLYNYLQVQRRGFGLFGNPEDPKIHDRVLNIQKTVLNYLLNPVVIQRITDSELYGNQYKLSEVIADLTNAVFKDDLSAPVNSFRQNLQAEYVNHLIQIFKADAGSRYNYASQALAYNQLQNIEKMLTANVSQDNDTKIHRQSILFRIKKAMETKI